jgi:hypothetical protein
MRSDRMRYAALFTATLLAVAGFFAPAASAAPPPNDDYSAPAVLAGPLPLVYSGDSSQATADPADPDTLHCREPLSSTTWHEWTAAVTGTVLLSVQSEAFEPNVGVFTVGTDGSVPPSDWCSIGLPATLAVTAGQRYLIEVGVPFDAVAPTGGAYQLTLEQAPPPADIEVYINRTVVRSDQGYAVSGTYRCTGGSDRPEDYTTVDFWGGELRQRGRLVGSFRPDPSGAVCDDTVRPWQAQTWGRTRPAVGQVRVLVSASVCTRYSCDVDSNSRYAWVVRARS